MTTLYFYKALILQGEIWCWSLLGLKGLKATCPARKSSRPGQPDGAFSSPAEKSKQQYLNLHVTRDILIHTQ